MTLTLHTNWIFSAGLQPLKAWWHKVQCFFSCWNPWKLSSGDFYLEINRKHRNFCKKKNTQNANLCANDTFVPFDFGKCFLFFSCENVGSSLSPCVILSLPPSLESLPSEAFDWKHALFNHQGDRPCPVFAPLPHCNNKGRVTLGVSSRRDVWRRERGERMKRERDGGVGGNLGEWKQELKRRRRAQGSIAGVVWNRENLQTCRNWLRVDRLRCVCVCVCKSLDPMTLWPGGPCASVCLADWQMTGQAAGGLDLRLHVCRFCAHL